METGCLPCAGTLHMACAATCVGRVLPAPLKWITGITHNCYRKTITALTAWTSVYVLSCLEIHINFQCVCDGEETKSWMATAIFFATAFFSCQKAHKCHILVYRPYLHLTVWNVKKYVVFAGKNLQKLTELQRSKKQRRVSRLKVAGLDLHSPRWPSSAMCLPCGRNFVSQGHR